MTCQRLKNESGDNRNLVSCLVCTFGRPHLLAEAIQCFLDQDYPHKELLICNDQQGVTIEIEDCPSNITVYNAPFRLESLGRKRNYLMWQARGEFCCVWDDDDLYTPWRISDSVKFMKEHPSVDIVKAKSALMSVDNQNYSINQNLFHSQACIRQSPMVIERIGYVYSPKKGYANKSVGEDIEFEDRFNVKSFDVSPYFWYVYRWGMGVHHLSGVVDDKESWKKSLSFPRYQKIKGTVKVKPGFKRDYWGEISDFLARKHRRWKDLWDARIKESLGRARNIKIRA